jgi:hypothetical protein
MALSRWQDSLSTSRSIERSGAFAAGARRTANMRGALSSAGTMRCDAVQSTRHQIIIATQNALDVECGASRCVGISSARGQNT